MRIPTLPGTGFSQQERLHLLQMRHGAWRTGTGRRIGCNVRLWQSHDEPKYNQ